MYSRPDVIGEAERNTARVCQVISVEFHSEILSIVKAGQAKWLVP